MYHRNEKTIQNATVNLKIMVNVIFDTIQIVQKYI